MLQKPDMKKPGFKMLGQKVIDLANDGKCIYCEKEIKEDDFRGEADKTEYSLSGMCQVCQDKVESAGEAAEDMEE